MAWHPPSIKHAMQNAISIGSAAHTAYQIGKGVDTVGKYLGPPLL